MDDSQTALLMALIGGVVLITLVAIVGGFLHSRRGRMLTHAERMKALELGREMPEDPATARIKAAYGIADTPEEAQIGPKSLAAQCYSTTGYVCGSGFVFAWMAGMGNPGVGYACAGAVGAIGVTGMICGTILASKAPSPDLGRSLVASKPRFDPEAV